MEETQHEVATFVDDHDLRCEPVYRVLDLVSEVSEIAKNATGSTGYGETPNDIEIEPNEIGDALFSLLALADSLEIDADDALDASLAKYQMRLDETGSASSGD